MDLSGFGGNFAANIATEIVKSCVGLLGNAILGHAETQPMTRCLTRAISVALSRLQLRGLLVDDLLLNETKTSIEAILGADATAVAFVTAAVTGHGDPVQLTDLAENAGLDPSTLPFDWEEFLKLFLTELDENLHEEAQSEAFL